MDSAHLAFLLKQQILAHSERLEEESGYAESSDDEEEVHSERRDSPPRSCNIVESAEDTILTFQPAENLRSFSGEHSRKRRADDMYLGPLSPTASDELALLRYPHLWPIKHARRSYEDPSDGAAF